MADLTQLPYEIIAEIWRYMLEPTDVESFALVSKHLYATGRSFVEEHNKLKREFSFFETGPNTRASAPAFLLKTILLRPRVALYVTHLSIGRYQFHWQDQDGYDDEDTSYSEEWLKTGHIPYPDDDMTLFIETIRKTSFVLQKDVESWIRRVKRGDEDPILALLSLLLPKLITITLKNTAEDAKELLETIQRISRGENRTFLTCLTTVHLQVDFPFENEAKNFFWLQIFSTLPLLQSIHVKRMTISLRHIDLDDEERHFVSGNSDVTEMTFVESGVGPKMMFELLGSIKGLKNFTYVEPNEAVNEFEPFWMRSALLAHAKHSLEVLKITSSRTFGKFLGTFSDFKALRELETNIHLLVRRTKFDKLANLFPASIETIHLHIRDFHLHIRDDTGTDGLPELIETIATAKLDRLPNLKVFKLTTELEPPIHKHADEDGQFRRKPSQFRDFISSAPDSKFPPEKDRYALYLNLGCPWAHRTNLVRSLKGLESIIQLIVCGLELTKEGWLFTGRHGSDEKDPLYGFTKLQDLYKKADPSYEGRFTVPALWDKKTQTIVNNESSEIIRMFYEEFDALLPAQLREEQKPGGGFYPEHLRQEIDAMNDWVYNTVNNGVYKTGFAATQDAYEASLYPLFESLDRLEKHLGEPGHQPYLFGEHITEADIRLYPTLIRFDVAYYNIFMCNLKMIRHDYPRLSRWLRNLYWDGGKTVNGHAFRDTVSFWAYKYGYLRAKGRAEPDDRLVVPKGPVPDIQPLDDDKVTNGH